MVIQIIRQSSPQALSLNNTIDLCLNALLYLRGNSKETLLPYSSSSMKTYPRNLLLTTTSIFLQYSFRHTNPEDIQNIFSTTIVAI